MEIKRCCPICKREDRTTIEETKNVNCPYGCGETLKDLSSIERNLRVV